MKIKWILLIVSVLAAFGCSYVDKIHIESKSLMRIDRSELASIIGEDLYAPLIQNLNIEEFLVISLAADQDVVRFLKETGSFVFANIYFCESPHHKSIFSTNSLYIKGVDVMKLKINEKKYEGLNLKSSDKKEFKLIIFTEWSEMKELPFSLKKDANRQHYMPYDLYKNELDLCIALSGGNTVRVIKSNEVRITSSNIKSMLTK